MKHEENIWKLNGNFWCRSWWTFAIDLLSLLGDWNWTKAPCIVLLNFHWPKQSNVCESQETYCGKVITHNVPLWNWSQNVTWKKFSTVSQQRNSSLWTRRAPIKLQISLWMKFWDHQKLLVVDSPHLLDQLEHYSSLVNFESTFSVLGASYGIGLGRTLLSKSLRPRLTIHWTRPYSFVFLRSYPVDLNLQNHGL